MAKRFSRAGAWIAILVVCVCTVLIFAPVVYADTDGTELQVTDQPEKLVIQLGAEWAGVEFELKTDAGVYPQPVVVSPEGVLSMELGGSTAYTLSCFGSSVRPPQPGETPVPDETAQTDPAPTPAPESASAETATPAPADFAESDAKDGNLIRGIPNLHLFLFAGGLIACVAGLVVMRMIKKRSNSRYDDDDDYYDDE